MLQEKKIAWEEDLMKFEVYLREKESSAATMEKYLRDVRTFHKYMKEHNEQNEAVIRKEDLLRYKEWPLKKYTASSANSMIVALNQFLICTEAGWMRIRRVKVQDQRYQNMGKELEKEEYRCLVRSARDAGQEQLAMIMETICATGIRISELKFFHTGNVKKGIIKVWNKGKYRLVLIPEKLRKKLLMYIAANQIKDGPVFCTRTGREKDRSNIWKEMKKLSKLAGIDPGKVFPHNLRHLFARTFYKTTKNLINLADILGHSNLEVTRIYTSEGIEQWRKNLEKLELIEI